MGKKRTQWHVLFFAALAEHGSPGVDALAELLLSKDPQRGDILLCRKQDVRAADVPDVDARARTLKHLWRFVEGEVLIEYKSPARPPQPGTLAKLVGYGGQLHHLRQREIGAFGNLLLCLVVTAVIDTLRREIQALDAAASTVAPGYLLVETRPYRILVVDLSEVVLAEQDEWMAIFVPSTVLTVEARRWLEEHMPAKDTAAGEKLEGHNEVLARLLQAIPVQDILDAVGTSRLLGSLAPQEIVDAVGTSRLLGSLAPEQRLDGLAPEQRLLAMPDSALRALSEEYVRTLPEDVQIAIRQRIAAGT